jgi:hypothetical protein
VLAVAVVLVLAAIVALVVWERSRDTPDTTASPPPSPPTTLPATLPAVTRQAPDGGEIRVVESGVSSGRNTLDQPMAQYGIMLENTSRGHVAVETEIVVTMLDAAGNPVVDQLESGAGRDGTRVKAVVSLAATGQRFGVGHETFVPPGTTVAAVKVEIGGARWYPTEAVRPGKVTTNQVKTANDAAGKRVIVDFTVESTYPVDLIADASAIFRDSSGAIVGGTNPEDSGSGRYPPGSSRQRITTAAPLPDRADVTRTEVYVYPQRSAFTR